MPARPQFEPSNNVLETVKRVQGKKTLKVVALELDKYLRARTQEVSQLLQTFPATDIPEGCFRFERAAPAPTTEPASIVNLATQSVCLAHRIFLLKTETQPEDVLQLSDEAINILSKPCSNDGVCSAMNGSILKSLRAITQQVVVGPTAIARTAQQQAVPMNVPGSDVALATSPVGAIPETTSNKLDNESLLEYDQPVNDKEEQVTRSKAIHASLSSYFRKANLKKLTLYKALYQTLNQKFSGSVPKADFLKEVTKLINSNTITWMVPGFLRAFELRR